MTAFHESNGRGADAVQTPSNRSFGLVFAGVLALIAVWSIASGGKAYIWAIAACGAFGLAAIAFPGVLAPLNRLWLRFGLLLHRLVSPLVLAVMFFLVLTPTALLMRALGKRPLTLEWNRAAGSYWVDRSPPGPAPESLKDQF